MKQNLKKKAVTLDSYETNAITEYARTVVPGSFHPEEHFYPRVLNAQIHPLVSYFLNLNLERIVARYCHLHPKVDPQVLTRLLLYHPQHFSWIGCDLFHVTTAHGAREMLIIETNSCPSGQKSMPLINEQKEDGGYRILLQRTFSWLLNSNNLPSGELAVIYDKNITEASGYAAAMADMFQTPVFLVPFDENDPYPPVKFNNQIMYVRSKDNSWFPVRAALRYVTQKPWNRIPLHSKTLIMNPMIGCLAGGRNKMLAAKAYENLNRELYGSGLELIIPETFTEIKKDNVPHLVNFLGGKAIVKIPYSNAGQGVYAITNQFELDEFMSIDCHYDKLIIQSLIGNYEWSSKSPNRQFYQVGTIPNRAQQIFAADIRMMISSGEDGYRPLAIYGRRARMPLVDKLDNLLHSWNMLSTNLSVKKADGGWDTETSRLLLVDRKDFNALGLGVDDLIDAFIQSVLAAVAIDKMACSLVDDKCNFRLEQFARLNQDQVLIDEILL